MSSTLSNSWELSFQQALFIRLSFVQILYGIYLVLYFKTMRLLLRPRERRKPSSRFYMFFTTSLLVLITAWIVIQLVFGDLMWVVNYNYPGGPLVFYAQHSSAWYEVFGVGVLSVLQLLTDALMIYRCYIVWDSYLVILMPCVLWLATCVTSILLDWSMTFPLANFWSGFSVRFAMSYFSLVSALNILSTSLICYRTMQHGLMVNKRLGKEPAIPYFDVTAVIVESMLPYTFSGILFLITFAIESPWSQLFLATTSIFNCISPQILILRVIMGRTWKRDTGFAPTSLKFAGPSAALGSIGAVDTGPYPLDISAVSARGSRFAESPESPCTKSSLQQESTFSQTDQKKFMEGSDERV